MSTLLYSEPQTARFVRGGRLRALRRPQAPFIVPAVRPTHLGPEHSRHYFHPSRAGAVLAPEDFRRKLKEIHPRAEAAWHPVHERWQIWLFAPDEMQGAPQMRGWKLVLTVQNPDGSYRPLDERTLAIIWDRTGRKNGSMKAYWDRIESEFWRDYQKQQQARADYRNAAAGDYYDYLQIKNIGRGSKFANHHAGD